MTVATSKTERLMWAAYDCTNDETLGVWTDICDAEEFVLENEGSSDVWGVFPTWEVLAPVK